MQHEQVVVTVSLYSMNISGSEPPTPFKVLSVRLNTLIQTSLLLLIIESFSKEDLGSSLRRTLNNFLESK